MSTVSAENHFGLFNIFNPLSIHQSIYKDNNKWNSVFPILGLLCSSNGWSTNNMSYIL